MATAKRTRSREHALKMYRAPGGTTNRSGSPEWPPRPHRLPRSISSDTAYGPREPLAAHAVADAIPGSPTASRAAFFTVHRTLSHRPDGLSAARALMHVYTCFTRGAHARHDAMYMRTRKQI